MRAGIVASTVPPPPPLWFDDFSVTGPLADDYVTHWTQPKTSAGSRYNGNKVHMTSAEGQAYAIRDMGSSNVDAAINCSLNGNIRRSWYLICAATPSATTPSGLNAYSLHLQNDDSSNGGIFIRRDGSAIYSSKDWIYRGYFPDGLGGMRLSVLDGIVKAKWWEGDVEPLDWMWTYNDPDPLIGTHAGFGVSNSSNRQTDFIAPFIVREAV